MSLPNEILDKIIASVSSPYDSYNISQASDAFKEMSERHLPSRAITCTLENVAVWKALTQDVALARTVKKVCVSRRYTLDLWTEHLDDEDLPEEMHTQISIASSEQEAERAFISALKNMPHIQELNWDRQPPLTSEIWDILSRLSIQKLTIRDANDIPPEQDGQDWQQEQRRIDSLWEQTFADSFKDLVEFEITTYSGQPKLTNIADFIQKNPKLEYLGIVLFNCREPSNVDMASLLNIYLPSLKSIAFNNVSCSTEEAVEFITRHPTLEKISVSNAFGATTFKEWRLPSLPNMKEVTSTPAVNKQILPHCQNITNIVVLEISSIETKASMFALLQKFPLIKLSIRITYEDPTFLRDLLKVTPNLEQLWLHSKFTPILDGPLEDDEKVKDIVNDLAQFKHLHTVRGIRFVNSDEQDPDQVKKDLYCLLSIAPNLRIVDSADEATEGAPRWIKVTDAKSVDFVFKKYEDFKW